MLDTREYIILCGDRTSSVAHPSFPLCRSSSSVRYNVTFHLDGMAAFISLYQIYTSTLLTEQLRRLADKYAQLPLCSIAVDRYPAHDPIYGEVSLAHAGTYMHT